MNDLVLRSGADLRLVVASSSLFSSSSIASRREGMCSGSSSSAVSGRENGLLISMDSRAIMSMKAFQVLSCISAEGRYVWPLNSKAQSSTRLSSNSFWEKGASLRRSFLDLDSARARSSASSVFPWYTGRICLR